MCSLTDAERYAEGQREAAECRTCGSPIWIVYHGPHANHTVEPRKEAMIVLFQITQRVDENEVDVEDSGMAKIATLSDASPQGLFVRVQSWSDEGNHAHFDQMLGKQVRVTVEVIE